MTLTAIVDHRLTERFILALIIINAITLGLETSKSVMLTYGPLLRVIDQAILTIFVVELLARIAVKRLRFFRDPWSSFDLFVVAIALVPASEGFSVLRSLRVLRALRLITAVPALRKVVAGLIGALPGMASIGLLLALVYYVFAVMGTKLFGDSNPELFGSIDVSAYTLFQLMTFDDWSGGVVKPLLENGHPYASAFVIVFMVLSAFMFLNLFIGVVVTALDDVTPDASPKLTHPAHGDAAAAAGDEREIEREILRELAQLRQEMARLRETVAARPAA
jgi:voltage-gated sodium channel